jgi:hypothetical protein
MVRSATKQYLSADWGHHLRHLPAWCAALLYFCAGVQIFAEGEHVMCGDGMFMLCREPVAAACAGIWQNAATVGSPPSSKQRRLSLLARILYSDAAKGVLDTLLKRRCTVLMSNVDHTLQQGSAPVLPHLLPCMRGCHREGVPSSVPDRWTALHMCCRCNTHCQQVSMLALSDC